MMESDKLPEPTGDQQSELAPIVKWIGVFQDYVAYGHLFTRDDIIRLRNMVRSIQKVRGIARDLGGDHDLYAGALYSIELPRVVDSILELADIDSSVLNAAETDEQYINALVSCFDRLEARATAGLVDNRKTSQPPSPAMALLSKACRNSIKPSKPDVGSKTKKPISRKKKNGRPKEFDPEVDKKLAERWKCMQDQDPNLPFEQGARDLGVKESFLRRAVDRHRKRIERNRR